MFVELKNTEMWSDLNQKFSQSANLGKGAEVQCYQGTQHALIELVFGLAQSFSHKNGVAFWDSCSPYFSKLKLQLAKQEQGVSLLPFQEFSKLGAWVSALVPTTLCCVVAGDHPVTAEKYDLADFNKAISTTRIFRIYLWHHTHHFRGLNQPVNEYEAHILSYGPELALTLLGRKVKISTLRVSVLGWTNYYSLDFSQLLSLRTQDEQKVLKFEQALQNLGAHAPLLVSKHDRFYDRAVFYFSDIDGDALIGQLKINNSHLSLPGFPSLIETTSRCRWGGLRTMDWLKEQGLSDETIRGLVLLDVSLLSDQLLEQIKLSVQQIREIQNFTP